MKTSGSKTKVIEGASAPKENTSSAPVKKTGKAGGKKKIKKNVTNAVAHINATFNNTIICITDAQGNVLSWSSSGMQGFKGSRKSTPYAAQMAAENAGRKAQEHGVKIVEIEVKGPGAGRESALRALQAVGLMITTI